MHYRWFQEDAPEDDYGNRLSRGEREQEAMEKRKKSAVKKRLGRAEKFWIVVAVLVVIFGALLGDWVLEMAAFAFLLFECRVLTIYLPPRYREPVSNGIKGFCIAIFIGAVFLAFL